MLLFRQLSRLQKSAAFAIGYRMTFGTVYPLYVQKTERKGRTAEEVDRIVFWLTGYDKKALLEQAEKENTFETFFAHAPRPNPDALKVNGMICGYRVEEIEDPLVRNVHILDKLIDEPAKGKSMVKILRK